MARPSHQPHAFHRRQVEALAGYGVPEGDIAGMVGIDAKTLRKHYKHELAFGHTKANAKVAENLFRKATGEGREAVIAAIFWLKARGRWKETSVNEHSGLDGKPIEQVHEIRRIILRAPDPASLGKTPAGSPPANLPVTFWDADRGK
ncbi:hypothetical protein [Mesorhizobium wenxiniae]|uniref:hypothetical protein n=1 Tax=Mesorhizobium wenxiniae TaxID=2014805 RepID=UPI001981B71C|nr:hypothetical protein [Mesorhizobium wenxiniae]